MNQQTSTQQYSQDRPSWTEVGTGQMTSLKNEIIEGKSCLLKGFKEREYSMYPTNTLNGLDKTGTNAVTLLQHSLECGYSSGITLSHDLVSKTYGTKILEDGRVLERSRNGPRKGEKGLSIQTMLNEYGYKQGTNERLKNRDGTDRVIGKTVGTVKVFNADQLQINLLEDHKHASRIEIREVDRIAGEKVMKPYIVKARAEPTLHNLTVAALGCARLGVGYKGVKLVKNKRIDLANECDHTPKMEFDQKMRDIPESERPAYESPFMKLSSASEVVLQEIVPLAIKQSKALDKIAAQELRKTQQAEV